MLNGRTLIAAGGTGNMGTHIARALLEHGATVVVPSRSTERLDALRDHLRARMGERELARLVPIVGDIGTESGAEDVVDWIVAEAGEPAGVVASLGNFVAAPDLLGARAEVLRRALDSYTVAHFTLARAVLPRLAAHGGRYVFVNGPLAFEPWEGRGAGLVSVATAAQHMLFRAVAQELAHGPAQVMELVVYAFVRERETQPGSPLPAEDVGECVAHLLSDDAPARHGQSIHLRSPEDLRAAR